MLVPSLIKEVFGNASCIVEPIMLSTSRGDREMEIVGAKEQLRKRMRVGSFLERPHVI